MPLLGLLSKGVGAIGGPAGLMSAGQLLFGENNIFSGKGRQAKRELNKAYEESQNKGINQGYYDTLAGQRARAQQGMGQASKALAFQQNAASTNAALAGADSGRARLAAIQGISRSGNDLALNLASQNEGIQRQNQAIADQSALNVAGLEDANWQRKMEERNAHWSNRLDESNKSIQAGVQGLIGGIGAAKKAGAIGKGSGLDLIGAPSASSSAIGASRAASTASSAFGMPSANTILRPSKY